MNTSDLSVIVKGMAGTGRGKPGAAKKPGGAGPSAHEAGSLHAAGSFAKFPKLKLVKAEAEQAQARDSLDEHESTDGPPILFDSLLAQMERKALQVLQEAAGEAPAPAAQQNTPSSANQIPGQDPVYLMRQQDADSAAVIPLKTATAVHPKLNVAPEPPAPAQWQNVLRQAFENPPETAAGPRMTAHVLSIGPDIQPTGKAIAGLNDALASVSGKVDQNVDQSPQLDGLRVVRQSFGADEGSQGRSQEGMEEKGKDAAPNQTPAAPASPLAGPLIANLPEAQTGPVPLRLTDQISAALKSEVGSGGLAQGADGTTRVITVQLHPEGLGHVAIRLEKVDGALKVSLSAEHASTTEHLRSGAAELVSALESLAPGFSTNDLSFDSQGQRQDAESRADIGQNGTNAGVAGNEHRRDQGTSHQASATQFQAISGPDLQGEGHDLPPADRSRRNRSPGSIYL